MKSGCDQVLNETPFSSIHKLHTSLCHRRGVNQSRYVVDDLIPSVGRCCEEYTYIAQKEKRVTFKINMILHNATEL